MNRPRLVNLLDDFALGGVSRGLGIFDSDAVRGVVDPAVVAIRSGAWIAPRLDAEIVVTHFPPNWRRLVFLASLRLRNPRARLIHVEHSYARNWEAANVGSRPRFRIMLRLALGLVHHVVAVSQAQKDWLLGAARLPPSKACTIYPYARNPGLAELPLPRFDQCRLLAVGTYGRFHEAKGFERLITAYRKGLMPGTRLVIGGFGPLEGKLRALAGEDPGIHFAGKVERVADFLEKCDLVAIPSRWETFGQVATEAREAGRPIIVANSDGLPEQVGKAGLVIDFGCDEAIVDAFGALSSSRLAAMAAAGREATQGCGAQREAQWARLLTRIAPRPISRHRPVRLPA